MSQAAFRAVCAVLFILANSFQAQAQQTPTGASNAGAVRSAILGVPLWHVERSNGTSVGKFEMRGDQLWAKFDNNDGKGLRDVQITVTDNGLTWIGTRGQVIVLRYDPKDVKYPFSGTDNRNGQYNFSPR